MAVLRPFIPLAEQLGQLAGGLAPGQVGRLDLIYSGALAAEDTRILTAAALTGLLKQHSDEPVNLVNARAVAHSRGIEVSESRTAGGGDFTNLPTVRSGGGPGVGGTTIGRDHRPWLVCVDGLPIEIELGGPMLVLRNADRPGMIGAVGTLLGAEGVNIANMNVSREPAAEEAVMVLALDSRPSADTLRRLGALDGIRSVRFVCLNGA
jgi:D-3-phosphoglycerate dehydrogenase / 2-oxoglutarate reductase